MMLAIWNKKNANGEGAGIISVQETLSHLQVDGWHVISGVIPGDKVGAVRESVLAASLAQDRAAEIQGVDSQTGLMAHDQSTTSPWSRT